MRPSIHSQEMGDLRYADAGVNIDEGNRAVSLIRRSIASTHGPQVLGGIGAFSGLFALEPGAPNGRVLASSTDSVGTKVKIAIATGRHRGIGVDLVNHCVNDILCCGADPLFFLDYYATGKLVPEHLAEIIEGIAEACRATGCALIFSATAAISTSSASLCSSNRLTCVTSGSPPTRSTSMASLRSVIRKCGRPRQ